MRIWRPDDLFLAQLVGMVDVVFADVAQPDQARIVALNSQYFLKVGGHFIISIKASCIDSTASPEAVFAAEVSHLSDCHVKAISLFFRKHISVMKSPESRVFGMRLRCFSRRQVSVMA